MLNKNVHNHTIQEHKRVSVERFVESNSGIDRGSDLPRPFLEEIFWSVSENEVRPVYERDGVDDVFLFTNPVFEGVLRKQASINKTWSKRYFRVHEKRLYYFTDELDPVEKGFFSIDGITVQVSESQRKQIEVRPKEGRVLQSVKLDRKGEVAMGRHLKLQLMASSKEEAAAWVSVLNKVSNGSE